MKRVQSYLLYFICILLLFLFLFFSVRIFQEQELTDHKLYLILSDYKENNIIDKEKAININYPKFEYKALDDKVKELIEPYKNKENVTISSTVNVTKDLVVMFYEITYNGQIFYENINYDLKEEIFIDNSSVYNFNATGNLILDKVKAKYSTYIYETVVNDNFKNAYIKVSDDGMYFYFSPSLFENIIHKVYIYLPNNNEEVVSNIVYDKVIAFTFDDGPSEYTLEIVEALILNDSKATFFELGNRMKYNQDIVREINNRGMEIGSHTYAHKNLNKLSEAQIDEEINSTNIIYNEITGGNIKYLRPPYGNANQKVKSRVNVPIITWSIDTNDWLYRDSDHVYNHILENVSDGDIVLMHDIYPETVEAVKKVLPALREMGYKITTVSDLVKSKGRTLENAVIYRSFKEE